MADFRTAVLTEPRTWLHTLYYQADSWNKARWIVLVVKERPEDLLLDRFFLVTSLGCEQMSRLEVLEHYRERGKAESPRQYKGRTVLIVPVF